MINSGSTQCIDKEAYNSLSCDYGNRDKWGQCFVYGDPHFMTIDGLQYRFNGICEYILAQYCQKSNGAFQVTASFEQGTGNHANATFLECVIIRWNGTTIKIWTSGKVTVNGDDILDSGSKHHLEGGNYEAWFFKREVLRIDIYVRIQLLGVDILRVCVKRRIAMLHFGKSEFNETLCGMCGTYDGRSSNDQDSNSNVREDPSLEITAETSGGDSNAGTDGGVRRRRRRRSLPISSGDQDFGEKWVIEGSCAATDDGGNSGGNSGNSGGGNSGNRR